MSKTTLVTQQVQLQEWFHMMQESKGRPQQIPLDEWCKENYGISAAGYYYRVRKVKEAYLDQVSEEKHQENLAIVPKELFHEDQGVQKNPSKLQTTDSFLDIFQDDLRIRIYENTDEQLLFCVLRNLKMLNDAKDLQAVYIVCGYTDLRKGIDSLSNIISQTYGMDPFQPGTLFMFCGRKTDRIKALIWEGDGFLLCYKRLEQKASKF